MNRESIEEICKSYKVHNKSPDERLLIIDLNNIIKNEDNGVRDERVVQKFMNNFMTICLKGSNLQFETHPNLNFIYDWNEISSVPDIVVKKNAFITLLIEIKDRKAKLQNIDYQIAGEAIACAAHNLYISDVKESIYENNSKFYALRVVGTKFFLYGFHISEKYLLSISGLRNGIRKHNSCVNRFERELDFSEAHDRKDIIEILFRILHK